MTIQNFEKLGVFYLGRQIDADTLEPTENLLLYDSKDLTTHAVVVGMTGSGKTGLCINLLEEAGIDRIPAIVIDPKGDISNLLLTFPDLETSDFRPWVDEGQASRAGMSADQFAAAEAAKWRKGLERWGQDGDRIRKLRDTVDIDVYTPGSNSGKPLTILKSISAPSDAVLHDSDALRESIQSAVSGLLALLGIDADPVRSREHILISNILNLAWNQRRDLDLGRLIGEIQNPPFDRVGIMDLDVFFPLKDRMALAMTINNMLASPAFSSWMQGEPLNIKRLLHTTDGKPRISIISISHLDDNERMFFVTILLNEVLSWMRTQSGTSSLRAILYMDEVFGYFPPSRNPPSKLPMLTLLKQARAFGLGVVLATQNPVDLDYKGLSNTGTWFLGRLQTERDKARVLDGLEGAATSTGRGFDRNRMDKLLSGLKARMFLMNNVHEDQPCLFETRWAMSYLRGPLTRQQLQSLCKENRTYTTEEREAQTVEVQPSRETGAFANNSSAVESLINSTQSAIGSVADVDPRQLVPSTVKQRYAELNARLLTSDKLVYRPALYAACRAFYSNATQRINYQDEKYFLVEYCGNEQDLHIWDHATLLCKPLQYELEPTAAAKFEPLPVAFQKQKLFVDWEKELKNVVYRDHPLELYRCADFRCNSSPGETLGDFKVRLEQVVSEHRDLETEKLRKKYEAKFVRVRDEIRRAESRLETESSRYKSRKLDSALSVGTSILGALLGRKAVSSTSARSAASSVKTVNRAANQKGEVEKARQSLQDAQEKYKALEDEFNRDVNELAEKLVVESLKIDTLSIQPKKTEITVRELALVWLPWRVSSTGLSEPVFDKAIA
ncbi:MAG TPA: DUF87 domain-containing protein [Pirellulaceae bacterium]|nr:DUF87 domain-containing protein [Pirellulaceae bacterium]HMO93370.1 DUF87 domain-containing protein [Pirellulaceae bacterium]HMP70429.1 DUF87 domain-containing protein [Pirellulaceae bacterium]